jgi:hypothetical protein
MQQPRVILQAPRQSWSRTLSASITNGVVRAMAFYASTFGMPRLVTRGFGRPRNSRISKQTLMLPKYVERMNNCLSSHEQNNPSHMRIKPDAVTSNNEVYWIENRRPQSSGPPDRPSVQTP